MLWSFYFCSSNYFVAVIFNWHCTVLLLEKKQTLKKRKYRHLPFNNQTFSENLICATGPSCLLSLLYLAFTAREDRFYSVSSNGVAWPTMSGWWSMRKRQMERRWKNEVKERENNCWEVEGIETKKQMSALFQEWKEKDSEHKKGGREEFRLVKQTLEWKRLRKFILEGKNCLEQYCGEQIVGSILKGLTGEKYGMWTKIIVSAQSIAYNIERCTHTINTFQ